MGQHLTPVGHSLSSIFDILAKQFLGPILTHTHMILDLFEGLINMNIYIYTHKYKCITGN